MYTYIQCPPRYYAREGVCVCVCVCACVCVPYYIKYMYMYIIIYIYVHTYNACVCVSDHTGEQVCIIYYAHITTRPSFFDGVLYHYY